VTTTAPSILSFELADDIAAAPDVESDYIVDQFLIKEAITTFSAKIKGGKTTFTGAMLKAILNETDIIGMRTRKARVLYCTEEGPKTFAKFLHRTGLTNTAGWLTVLFLGKIPKGLPWKDTVDLILAHCIEQGIEVVIFDTLTRWAKIRAEQEGDAGAAATAMEPLETLRAQRLAVYAIFHDRKSGGDVTDSMRGSSAFGGAADILLGLTNPGTTGHPNRRELTSLGRFDDPGTWLIEWNAEAEEYALLADTDGARVDHDAMVQKIRMCLDLHMGMEVSRPELAKFCGVRSSHGTFGRAIDELVEKKKEVIVGGGNGRGKGNAHTYRYA
jgi:hypothetical protein